MKNILSLALMLPVFSVSVIFHAAHSTGSIVVQRQQSGGSPSGSFSLKPDQRRLPGTPSYPVNTDGYAESILPDDKRHRINSYGVKTSFIESISWQLIYAAHVLIACEWVVTTNDAALKAKPYPWIPADVFVSFGSLLKSYWNPDSSIFSPTESLNLIEQKIQQQEANQDHLFTIISMMLPGNGQQKNSQPNPPSASSGQQASGVATHAGNFYFTNFLSFGSGDGKENPDQHQHTLGVNCYVDSCNGICKIRPSFDSSESAEGVQQGSPPPAQREIKRRKTYPIHGHIGGDLLWDIDLPSLEWCLAKRAYEGAYALSDSEELDLSKVDEETFSSALTEFFVDPILTFLNYRVLVTKHDRSDEYVHLAAAMCNALGNEYEYIVGFCASCAHTFKFGFSHSLFHMARVLTKSRAHKSWNLHQFRQDVIEGLDTDRQTLAEKIAHREVERVNTILQQGSSIEDKYEPVGNLALIFFALSANNRKEAVNLFWEACFIDADGNRITRDDEPPVFSGPYTTEPTETYRYVYSSVRNLKDIAHLQKLVNLIKNFLIADKGTASANCENRPLMQKSAR
ncbi:MULTISPECIES: hypothetical protein [unclassified Endozoicomonas]|uniref:hypothetical protein n=1 Tax=unclassified Endozoicomonas TaxID=2644528 RepID=UPI0021490D36|nr:MULTISPECIES: hypothetical protein [unclassified Endozoicomonas]